MATKTVLDLVEDALEAFDDPAARASGHVRRAIRIASKRQDYLALIRFLPETFDLTVGKPQHASFEEARANLVALLGPEEAEKRELDAIRRHHQGRQMEGGKIFGQSIAQLEGSLSDIDEVIAGYKAPPQNLTPIDTYFVAREYDANTAKIMPLRRQTYNAIERVKQAVYDFLVETERQIELGQRRPDIFTRGQEYLERALRDRAPEALAKFQAAEAALKSGEAEDLAHALTSCRRMIKALADALYPATNEMIIGSDGKSRKMSDEAYRNRLLQFALVKLGRTTHGDLANETLRSLGARLERLVELSSKGVHADVTRVEAETCIMWTCLTAVDFLRIADGTAAVETADADTHIMAGTNERRDVV